VRQGVRTASLALLAGTLGVLTAIYTTRTYALNRRGQITDRFYPGRRSTRERQANGRGWARGGPPPGLGERDDLGEAAPARRWPRAGPH
jgi:hypothetical protein